MASSALSILFQDKQFLEPYPCHALKYKRGLIQVIVIPQIHRLTNNSKNVKHGGPETGSLSSIGQKDYTSLVVDNGSKSNLCELLSFILYALLMAEMPPRII